MGGREAGGVCVSECGNLFGVWKILRIFADENYNIVLILNESFFDPAIIENYYPHFIQFNPDDITDIEFSFDGIQVDNHTIKGKIDRIEKQAGAFTPTCFQVISD